tara:strand:+ start:263 stop:472 length:210 start_codon:yes stop_codon:yes gene_type:complete
MSMTKYVFWGVTFYEHPTLGDEAPLLVKKYGKFYETDLWQAPECEDEAHDARANAIEITCGLLATATAD